MDKTRLDFLSEIEANLESREVVSSPACAT
jgi:hypothetical protein